jgi:hypothetical protein
MAPSPNAAAVKVSVIFLIGLLQVVRLAASKKGRKTTDHIRVPKSLTRPSGGKFFSGTVCGALTRCRHPAEPQNFGWRVPRAATADRRFDELVPAAQIPSANKVSKRGARAGTNDLARC